MTDINDKMPDLRRLTASVELLDYGAMDGILAAADLTAAIIEFDYEPPPGFLVIKRIPGDDPS